MPEVDFICEAVVYDFYEVWNIGMLSLHMNFIN